MKSLLVALDMVNVPLLSIIHLKHLWNKFLVGFRKKNKLYKNSDHLPVHDRDLRRWAMQKNKSLESPLSGFLACDTRVACLFTSN